jgi:hypothetical protein
VSVVIDANALVAFVTNEPAAPKVTELLHGWGSEGTAVNAPALARYEIANALATADLQPEIETILCADGDWPKVKGLSCKVELLKVDTPAGGDSDEPA